MTNFVSGYIESYFGRLLSHTERLELLAGLKDVGLNTYVYAPKEDPYIRVRWKEKYPTVVSKDLKLFCKTANSQGIKTIVGISPGLCFNYSSYIDYRLLLKKFRMFHSLGFSDFALLMDDIPQELPVENRESFSSLGEAHGLLLCKLKPDIESFAPNATLIFCPTVYSDQIANCKVRENLYLRDLAKKKPVDVPIFWTGEYIVSEKITKENTKDILKLFNGNVIIWDNYYANDYTPTRVFLGTYKGRKIETLKKFRGVLINPTGHTKIDSFLMELFSNFLKHGKQNLSDWKRIAQKHGFPKNFSRILKYFDSPYRIFSEKELSPSKLNKLGNIYEEILIPWISKLKNELFPYIHSFDRDIFYINMEECEFKEKWRNRNYSPIVAKKIEIFDKNKK